MKKIFSVFFMACLLLATVACGGGNKTTTTTTTTTSNTTTTGEKIEYPDLQGKTFTIMCDNKDSCDPRSDSYQRLFKKEKMANIAEVEKNYNVKIEYVNYPSAASWGGARERWIAEQATL